MKSKTIHKNKNLFLISGLMIIVAVVLLGLMSWFFTIAKENTINMWGNSVTETATSVQTYINTAEDAISFTGIQINEMLDSGSSQEEIKDFVLNQSGIYSAFIDGCYNGLYGYINGEYITSGRENYSEYDVITSKWYLAARQANGGTAFVSPYMNEHAHTMMMSVSRTLSDNSSVISMDLLLVDYQQLLDNLVEQNKAGFAAIIDKDGTVICHEHKEEIGKNYYKENNSIKEELMNKITNSQENNYEMSYDGHKYIGFFDTCSNGWYVVMALDRNDVFYSLRRVYMIAIFVLLVAVIALVINMWLVITKQNEVDKLGEEITEEKKRGEDLKKISETDKMTGILNRGGGEAKVRENLVSGYDGMFCVITMDMLLETRSSLRLLNLWKEFLENPMYILDLAVMSLQFF